MSWTRVPRGARRLVTGLLLGAIIPPAALVYGGISAFPPAGWSANVVTTHVAAIAVAVVALIAFEPPRSASPLAYARQLRARFLEIQSTLDADNRHRPEEGKEKEDDRAPSEP